MGKVWQSVVVVLGACAVLQAFSSTPVQAQLDPFFYWTSCPQAIPILAGIVHKAIQIEKRMAGSLLRLHFHDCFVQGCDASILLHDSAANGTEDLARPNLNSVRGFSVIDEIKDAVENTCPGVVSCADIVALSSFFSVVLTGGPIWPIPLGRRDSLLARNDIANDSTTLPGPSFNISQLKTSFLVKQNLSSTDLVALSGGHTIGKFTCGIAYPRLYNNSQVIVDPTLNATLAAAWKDICYADGSTNVTTTLPMDVATFGLFDNSYFKHILTHEAAFRSDNSLLDAEDTKELVNTYATNQNKFFVDFAQSMINMGNLQVLTGTQGEIRQKCYKINPSGTQSVIEQVIQDGKQSRPENIVKEISAEDEVIFKDYIMEVVNDIGRKILEKKIEETLGDGIHSYM